MLPSYPFILVVSKPKYFGADYAYISIIFFILIISFVIALLMKNTVLLSKVLSQNDHYFKLALYDEFVMLLPNKNGQEAERYINALLEKIRMIRVDTSLGEICISSSIGISEVRSPKESIAKWLDRTDKALYEAKNQGRNCVVLKVSS
ncbi:diguanylate cyclase domain-containing protein [Aliivibrio logei]|uniref:diguanylate cyclase domain-containing protein n=1 Tax=Aliivibrio logei TaxID=688 RepID=UPI0035C8958A